MAILSKYEIEAAWVRLKPHVDRLKRGDDVSDEWLVETSGIDKKRIEPRLRRYLYRRGIHTKRRLNVIHLLTDVEQREIEDDHMLRGHRQEARAYHANKHVDRASLGSDRERAAADYDQRFLEGRLRSYEEFRSERKSIVGVPSPQPRPQLGSIKK